MVANTANTDDETDYEIKQTGYTLTCVANTVASMNKVAQGGTKAETERGDYVRVEYLSAASCYDTTTVAEGRIVSWHKAHTGLTMLRNDGATVTVDFSSDPLTVYTNGRKTGEITAHYDGTGIDALRADYERVPVATDGGTDDDTEDSTVLTDNDEAAGFLQSLEYGDCVRFDGDKWKVITEASDDFVAVEFLALEGHHPGTTTLKPSSGYQGSCVATHSRGMGTHYSHVELVTDSDASGTDNGDDDDDDNDDGTPVALPDGGVTQEEWECGDCGHSEKGPVDGITGEETQTVVGSGRREKEVTTVVCPSCGSDNWHSESVRDAFMVDDEDTDDTPEAVTAGGRRIEYQIHGEYDGHVYECYDEGEAVRAVGGMNERYPNQEHYIVEKEEPEVRTDGGMPPGERAFIAGPPTRCDGGRVEGGHDTPPKTAPEIVVNHPNDNNEAVMPFSSRDVSAVDDWVVYLADGRKFDCPDSFRVSFDNSAAVTTPGGERCEFEVEDIARIEWHGRSD